MNLSRTARPRVLLPLVLLVAGGCGNKQDFSGSDELAKSKSPSASAPQTPSGAVPTAHAGMMVPNQQRPPNSGG